MSSGTNTNFKKQDKGREKGHENEVSMVLPKLKHN
jgi:hypothetical protein